MSRSRTRSKRTMDVNEAHNGKQGEPDPDPSTIQRPKRTCTPSKRYNSSENISNTELNKVWSKKLKLDSNSAPSPSSTKKSSSIRCSSSSEPPTRGPSIKLSQEQNIQLCSGQYYVSGPALTFTAPITEAQVSLLKGQPFLQNDACDRFGGIRKCQECSSGTAGDSDPDICRFTYFRKLRYDQANGRITVVGFADPVFNPSEEDLRLWLPRPRSNSLVDLPKLTLGDALFIENELRDQFRELLKTECESFLSFLNIVEKRNDATGTPIWKKKLFQVRELCDVCQTTIFNYHWSCGNCGFISCCTCYNNRAASIEAVSPPAKMQLGFGKWENCRVDEVDDKRSEPFGHSLLFVQCIPELAWDQIKEWLDEGHPYWDVSQFRVPDQPVAVFPEKTQSSNRYGLHSVTFESESDDDHDDDDDIFSLSRPSNVESTDQMERPITDSEASCESVSNDDGDTAKAYVAGLDLALFSPSLLNAEKPDQISCSSATIDDLYATTESGSDDNEAKAGIGEFDIDLSSSAEQPDRMVNGTTDLDADTESDSDGDEAKAGIGEFDRDISSSPEQFDRNTNVTADSDADTESDSDGDEAKAGIGEFDISSSPEQFDRNSNVITDSDATIESVSDSDDTSSDFSELDLDIKLSSKPPNVENSDQNMDPTDVSESDKDVSNVSSPDLDILELWDEFSSLPFDFEMLDDLEGSSIYMDTTAAPDSNEDDTIPDVHRPDSGTDLSSIPVNIEMLNDLASSRIDIDASGASDSDEDEDNTIPDLNGFNPHVYFSSRPPNLEMFVDLGRSTKNLDPTTTSKPDSDSDESNSDLNGYDICVEVDPSSRPYNIKKSDKMIKITRRKFEPNERIPVPVLRSSSQLRCPNIPHGWLCNGFLLHLKDPNNKDNHVPFHEVWKCGQPVLVSDLSRQFTRELWSPAAFEALTEATGEHEFINIATGESLRGDKGAFWQGFENVDRRLKDKNGKPMLLKLKDWPPKEDFADVLPIHFQDLMTKLPLPEYTRRDGKYNLVDRLPNSYVRPDLGPKMYIAYASPHNVDLGTTNLHLDMSDAVNIMVYVGVPTDGQGRPAPNEREVLLNLVKEDDFDTTQTDRVEAGEGNPGALWHIYHHKDSNAIRTFLREIAMERNLRIDADSDPIHDQSFYLDIYLRRRLMNKYNVRGYPIIQCMGDAVFIPAGAPHQVRNVRSCIKIAEDFVTPENIVHCFKLTEEFRNLSSYHHNHEDKLQIKNITYHSMKDVFSVLEANRR